MGDSFTNFLLVTLIALLAWIAKVFYSKLESFEDKIEAILIGDVSHTKDIEHLKEAKVDHEKRITDIERKRTTNTKY